MVISTIGKLSRKFVLLRKIFNRLGVLNFVNKHDYTEIIKLSSGQYFKVNVSDWVDFRCFVTGSYDIEEPYEKVLIDLSKSNNVSNFFDIGANHGYYTVKIGQLLKNCSVYSFEPFSGNRVRLEENINLNNLYNCTILDYALADKIEDRKIFYSGDKNSGSSSLIPMFDNNNVYEDINCTTFDQFVSTLSINENDINMFKIDVEGFELNVLRGMNKFLKEHQCIVFVEHNTTTLNANNVCVKDIVSFMENNGYTAYDIQHGDLNYKYYDGNRGLVLYMK